jgi:hypothetical protein
MDDAERESQEAWKRLDNLRAQSEMGRMRGQGGSVIGNCLGGCGGMLAVVVLIAAATLAMLMA